MAVIDKVIMSLQESDDMERINSITGISYDNTDNWVDIETIEENPELKQYISEDEYDAMLNGEADYIAFRIDE